jgi:hypothetical protein
VARRDPSLIDNSLVVCGPPFIAERSTENGEDGDGEDGVDVLSAVDRGVAASAVEEVLQRVLITSKKRSPRIPGRGK